MTACPCRFGEPFEQCCGPLLAREKSASTAVQLMRSRYTAFAVGDVDYLLYSWDPSARPTDLSLDPDQRWLFLEVLATSAGGLMDTDGVVEFRAHYKTGRQRDSLHEVSKFVRFDGRWVYLDSM